MPHHADKYVFSEPGFGRDGCVGGCAFEGHCIPDIELIQDVNDGLVVLELYGSKS